MRKILILIMLIVIMLIGLVSTANAGRANRMIYSHKKIIEKTKPDLKPGTKKMLMDESAMINDIEKNQILLKVI